MDLKRAACVLPPQLHTRIFLFFFQFIFLRAGLDSGSVLPTQLHVPHHASRSEAFESASQVQQHAIAADGLIHKLKASYTGSLPVKAPDTKLKPSNLLLHVRFYINYTCFTAAFLLLY